MTWEEYREIDPLAGACLDMAVRSGRAQVFTLNEKEEVSKMQEYPQRIFLVSQPKTEASPLGFNVHTEPPDGVVYAKYAFAGMMNVPCPGDPPEPPKES